MADVESKRKGRPPTATGVKKDDDIKKRAAPAENGDAAPAKRGRGRPPKKGGAVNAKKDTSKAKGPSKGRGRPAKAIPKKKDESEDDGNDESPEDESS